jgi:hypothetical protein
VAWRLRLRFWPTVLARAEIEPEEEGGFVRLIWIVTRPWGVSGGKGKGHQRGGFRRDAQLEGGRVGRLERGDDSAIRGNRMGMDGWRLSTLVSGEEA